MSEWYELSPEALEDLLKIQDFISLDNPAAAARLIGDFFTTFEQLARWPGSGHSRTDLTLKPALFWPMNSYLIVYHVQEKLDLVQIIAILHQQGTFLRFSKTAEIYYSTAPFNSRCAAR
jgi:plasmid stabilization system protein ParE